MKSIATRESADGNQFIDALKSSWNTLSFAGLLALFASFALGSTLVSANAQTTQDDIAPSLTVEQARAIVTPLYEALNEPTSKNVSALLAKQPTLTTDPVRPTRIVCHVINWPGYSRIWGR